MASFLATLTAWDVLDKVHVTVYVKRYDALGAQAPTVVWQDAVTVQGEGEDDEKAWLKDALVAMLENL